MVQVPIELAGGGGEAAQSRHSTASLERTRQVHNNGEEKQRGTRDMIISRAASLDEGCKKKMSCEPAQKKEAMAEKR